MDILKIKVNGQWVPVEAIKGDKGDPGKDGEPGPQGIPGNDYVITQSDYDEIATTVYDNYHEQLKGDPGPEGPQGPPGQGATNWSELNDKPFNSIGNNLEVVDGVLNALGGGSSLPDYPTDNGNYSLIVTINGEKQTLTWNPIAGVWDLPTKILNDLRMRQAVSINKMNNNLEVF